MELKKNLLFWLLLVAGSSISAQSLVIDAGTSATICPGYTYNIGGSPTVTGGIAPYTFVWTPNTAINNNTISNPVVNPSVPTWYYVTVTDSAGTTGIDSVLVNLDPIYAFNAGPDTSVCIGDTITLGAIANTTMPGITYSWVPVNDLSDATAPRPAFTGTLTTTYTLTVASTISTPNCPSKQFEVTVTVNPLPVVIAAGAATIEEGQSTPLTATGAVNYIWTPTGSLSNSNEPLTNAEPTATTLYVVYGIDANGCVAWDSLTVTVIPNNEIVLYNTFSPNNDGINDFFHIGNIQKYPECRLEVFTRTGQLVYAKTGYDNSWDGTNYGDKLPETTYYYTLDPGDDSPVLYGHVTIVR